VAYNKNFNVNQNSVANISGSKITLTGSLFGSEISGTTSQFTTVSASAVSASTYYGLPENITAQQLVLRCVNKSGADIAKGKVVHITSSLNNSDTPHIVLASWDSDLSSANTLGMTMETIVNNTTGSVILTGMLAQVPLTGTYTDGQMIYLSSSGDVTPTKPVAPLHEVRIGQVTRTINSGNNTVFIRVQNGYELDELHDVLVSGKQNGDLLVYNSSTGIWNNSKTLSGSYTITGSLTASNLSSSNITGSISGSGAQFTTITGSTISGSQITGSMSGASGIFGTLTGSTTSGSTATFTSFTGSISGTNGTFGTLTGSTTSGSTALFTNITASNISASNYYNLPAATAAGSAGYIQFNTGSNVLGADSNFVWDNTNKRLAIGKSTANEALDVIGSVVISSNLTVSGSIAELSTRTIKSNIQTLSSQLESVNKLNPVSYIRKDDNRKEYGFISEEVREIYPEFVVGEGINYPKMVSVLVSSIKELTQRIENQQTEIELLKNKKRTTRGKK
jgi:hypothetical protein